MAMARTSRALKASKALFILLKSSTDWTGSLKNELFSFRGFTQLLITFFFFFWKVPPLKIQMMILLTKTPQKNTGSAFPRGFTACGDCGHLSQRATHSQTCGGKPSNPAEATDTLWACGWTQQSRRLCQENSSFSNLWEGEKESKLLENIEGLDQPF